MVGNRLPRTPLQAILFADAPPPGPLTVLSPHGTPAGLLPVAGTPLLTYQLASLAAGGVAHTLVAVFGAARPVADALWPPRDRDGKAVSFEGEPSRKGEEEALLYRTFSAPGLADMAVTLVAGSWRSVGDALRDIGDRPSLTPREDFVLLTGGALWGGDLAGLVRDHWARRNSDRGWLLTALYRRAACGMGDGVAAAVTTAMCGPRGCGGGGVPPGTLTLAVETATGALVGIAGGTSGLALGVDGDAAPAAGIAAISLYPAAAAVGVAMVGTDFLVEMKENFDYDSVGDYVRGKVGGGEGGDLAGNKIAVAWVGATELGVAVDSVGSLAAASLAVARGGLGGRLSPWALTVAGAPGGVGGRGCYRVVDARRAVVVGGGWSPPADAEDCFVHPAADVSSDGVSLVRTTVAAGATVAAGVTAVGATLLSGVTVMEGVRLGRCVLGAGARVGAGACVGDGAVVGAGVVVAPDFAVPPGTWLTAAPPPVEPLDSDEDEFGEGDGGSAFGDDDEWTTDAAGGGAGWGAAAEDDGEEDPAAAIGDAAAATAPVCEVDAVGAGGVGRRVMLGAITDPFTHLTGWASWSGGAAGEEEDDDLFGGSDGASEATSDDNDSDGAVASAMDDADGSRAALARFHGEVIATVARIPAREVNVDNLVLELNALKLAEDRSVMDVTTGIGRALVRAVVGHPFVGDPPGLPADIDAAASVILDTWATVLLGRFDWGRATPEEERALVDALADEADHGEGARFDGVFKALLHGLFSKEQLSLDALHGWANVERAAVAAGTSGGRLLTEAGSILEFAEVSEESDESYDEESDESYTMRRAKMRALL
ncbi:hypothetical protein MMPV_004820 [Pyropia vietnamensis]